MKLYVIRHGETISNKENRIQGQVDTCLSDLGQNQAHMTAKRLQKIPFSAIYSSDLIRAKETAEKIASLHELTVNSDSRLRESSFGIWEGLTVDEVKQKFPDSFNAYVKDSINNRPPGGEKPEDLLFRVSQFIEEIASQHPNDTVAVITHGGPVKALFCHAINAGLETFRKISVFNCSLTVMNHDAEKGWKLDAFNDNSHLDNALIDGADV